MIDFAMFPEPGEKLGPYEILGKLGGGAMARVFRAWDVRLHREVAIKVIDDRDTMPGIAERFLIEARAAFGLNHPNICTIFDVGQQENSPYVVMELLEGETLKSRMSKSAMRQEDILRHSAEVADALAAAHSRCVVHRDIKPANIFLMKKPSGTSQAKVMDFGLAAGLKLAAHFRPMGTTMNLDACISPEQIRGEDLDARSDLFSLGAVMYEMATGRLPFVGTARGPIFVQLLGESAPEPIRKINAEIPVELERVILKLLAKEPGERFQTASELCEELQDLGERRSGWLTRMKEPHEVESAFPSAPVSAPNGRHARSPKPPGPALSPHDSPGPPADLKLVAIRYDSGADKPAVGRSGRFSMKANPRISFPTVAPYSGQTSAQMSTPSMIGSEESGIGTDRPAPHPPGKKARYLSGVPASTEPPETSTSTTILVAALAIAFAIGLIAWSMGWLGTSLS